jgi:O-antigen/teichoic acid export membrane protein
VSASAIEFGRRKFLHDVAGTLGTKLLLVPITLGTSIIVARALAPAGRGIYATVVTAIGIFLLLGSLGMNKAAIYFIAKDRQAGAEDVRRTAFWISVAQGVVLMLIVALVGVALSRHLLQGLGLPWLAVLIAAPLGLVGQVRATWEGFLRGDERNHSVNAVALVYGIVFLVGAGAVAALGALGVNEVLVLRVAASVVATAVAYRFLGRRCRGIGLGIVRADIASSLLRYGVPYALMAFLQAMNYDFDVLLVQAFRSNVEVGWYATAASVGELLWYLPTAVGFVIFPRVARLALGDAFAEAVDVGRKTLTVTLLGGAIVALLAPVLVSGLYGDAFAPAVEPLRLLLPGIVLNTWFAVYGGVMLGLGQVRPVMASTFIGVITNVVLNLWLIPVYGISGAAVASTISYAATAIASLMIFARFAHVSPRLAATPGRVSFHAGA